MYLVWLAESVGTCEGSGARNSKLSSVVETDTCVVGLVLVVELPTTIRLPMLPGNDNSLKFFLGGSMARQLVRQARQ